MKSLVVYRYNSSKPYTCTNGDVYDSVAQLSADGKIIWESERVNTDATKGYNGGRLAPLTCFGIVSYRENADGTRGKRVIKLFKHPRTGPVSAIKSASQLTLEDMTFVSEIPNPNHGYRKVIATVQVHAGGVGWDFSHGCISVFNGDEARDYNGLLVELEDNEVISFTLFNPVTVPYN